jgi:hypothetical protein
VSATSNPAGHQQKLLILCGPPGIGKSSMVTVLASELNIKTKIWQDGHADGNRGYLEQGDKGGLARWWRDEADSNIDVIRPDTYHSQQDDFRSFLLRSSAYSSLTFQSSGSSAGSASAGNASARQEIIVLDSLPVTESSSKAQKDKFHITLRSFLSMVHTSRCRHPAVLIFSDAAEKVNPTHLKNMLSEEVIDSQYVSLLHVNPVPDGILSFLVK